MNYSEHNELYGSVRNIMSRNYLITVAQLSPCVDKYLLAVTRDDADIVHLCEFDRLDLLTRRIEYLKRQYPGAQTLWLGDDSLPAVG